MTKSSFSIHLEGEILSVEGEICFDNVMTAAERGLVLMQSLENVQIELGGLKHCDSSTLAMCSAWVRARRQQKRTISFVNLPAFMYDLIRVHGLDLVLPLGRSDGKINYSGR